MPVLLLVLLRPCHVKPRRRAHQLRRKHPSFHRIGSPLNFVSLVSDSAAADPNLDQSGAYITQRLAKLEDYSVKIRTIIPDDKTEIQNTILAWTNEVDLILTSGGTGYSPRDITPDVLIIRHLPVIKR